MHENYQDSGLYNGTADIGLHSTDADASASLYDTQAIYTQIALTEQPIDDVEQTIPNGLEKLDTVEFYYIPTARPDYISWIDRGELFEEKVTNAEEAHKVLREIKLRDQERKTVDSYRLRQELLRRSNGESSMSSAAAYTYGELPVSGLKPYLDNPDNWLEERRQIHESIIETKVAETHVLDSRIKAHRIASMVENGALAPIRICLRGNTASGKTRAMKELEDMRYILDPATNEPTGKINTDDYKYALKWHEQEVADGKKVVANQQVHHEGSMLNRAVQRRLGEGMNIVVDGRLADQEDIDEQFSKAKAEGTDLYILDIDVPLMLSAMRVLGRPVNEEDPNAEFRSLAEGYKGIRDTRQELVQRIVINSDQIDGTCYYKLLYVQEMSGQAKELCIDDIVNLSPDSEIGKVIYWKPTDINDTIDQVRNTRISSDFIDRILREMFPYADGNDIPADEQWMVSASNNLRAVLDLYVGDTIEDAVNNRAKRLA